MVPVALHVVQKKDGAIALRQLADRTSQRNAVDCSPQAAIVLTEINLFCLFVRRVGALVEGNLAQSFLPEVHKRRIHRHAIDPGGEGRITSKCGEFTEDLNESI